MLKTLKIICRVHKRKDGGEFTSLSCKGEYLPLVLAELDTYYTIKFTKNSKAPEPAKEGIYQISFDEKGMWIDNRYQDKHIVRVNVERIIFDKPLPVSK